MSGLNQKTRRAGNWYRLIMLGLSLALAGCESLQTKETPYVWPDIASGAPSPEAMRARNAAYPESSAEGEKDEARPRDPVVYRGTGRFINQSTGLAEAKSNDAGDITLNFQNADLKEVIGVVLGDMLGVNYVLDPAVQGAVTIQTTRPLRRDDLLPTLETLLRTHGFAAVKTGDTYRILPIDKAVRGELSPQLGGSSIPLPQGYSLRIVPLSYISAAEMAEILQPIAPANAMVRIDTTRNLLVLAGTGKELSHLLDVIEIFDVNWVKGVSVAFFPLQNAKASEVEAKLEAIIGPKGSSALQGLFRIAAVESANGLLVITPQPDYLKTIGQWVERLDGIDAVSGGDERQLFVYRVKSGEAATLAQLLNQLLGTESSTVSTPRPLVLAPGETPINLGSQASGSPTAEKATAATPLAALSARRPGSTSSEAGTENGVRVVADESRNSLLITATAREYRKILKALADLDIPPLQVMIEATIIEVKLEGGLQYGLQWFFNTSREGYTGNISLDGTLDSATNSGLGEAFPGFNFSVIDSVAQVRAVFSALAEDSLVHVLSSPSVMVLDNGTARIQVGDQVPIATQQQQSTSENSNIINSIQYRDTGIVLEVTPRVTPGGLVTMEVEQEVSDVSSTRTSTLDSPTITTRKISSSVAVVDGQAVVLGGLIRDRNENSDGGLPGLKDVPGFGWLFGQTSKSNERNELVVILTPRVIVNPDDVARVTDDFRSRMLRLQGAF